MLTEVMRHYRLARPPVDAGFYETEHHKQIVHDLRATIMAGRLIALTAVIGSGKSLLVRRLREALEQVPAQLAAGYTSICFKPSMYTDDPADVPELCRRVVAAIAAM